MLSVDLEGWDGSGLGGRSKIEELVHFLVLQGIAQCQAVTL